MRLAKLKLKSIHSLELCSRLFRTRFARLVFLGFLAVVSLFAALVAVRSVTLAWETSDTAQRGQLTLYNPKEFGGLCGLPVEMGDFNGDGHMDLVIAPRTVSSGSHSDRGMAGEVYVFRGDSRIEGVVDLADFDGMGKATLPGLSARRPRR